MPRKAAIGSRSALSKLGLIKKSKHRDRRVSDAEIKRIIEHLDRKATALPLSAILWFSVASAARISETCRLRWADLNEADKTIRIRDRKHPSEKIGNRQIVPLLTVAGHDAFEIVSAQPRKGKRIFPANPKTVGTYFTDTVDELKIKDLHLHDLRHGAISRLFESEYRIEQVALGSGHRDWASLRQPICIG